MRKIKFRVWDTDEFKYRYDCMLTSDGAAYASWGKEKYDWIVELATGLKDSTGKEIFENDILEDSFGFRFFITKDTSNFNINRYVANSKDTKIYTFKILQEYCINGLNVVGNTNENSNIL